MSPQEFTDAKQFVATLDTTDAAAFGQALAAKGFPWDKTDSIPWWEATTQERAELQKLVKAGAQQARCKPLLGSYCTKLSPGQSLDAARSCITGEFDRSGWFFYFLQEAAAEVGGNLDGPEAKLVIKIGNSFFYRHTGNYQVKVAYDSVEDQKLRQLMSVLLTIGFERVPATKQQILAGDSSTALIMSRMRFADNSSTDPMVSGDKTTTAVPRIPVQFKWRGDARGWDSISTANGFSTKANSDGYASRKGLREAWHPFSHEGFRSYLWFRKGQTDNCLYSVVSVGTGVWKAFLVYPKIALSGGRVENVDGYLGTRKLRCRKYDEKLKAATGNVVELDLPTSEVHLYLFLQMGVVFDTAAAQGANAYPEVGMANIPLTNIFGCVRFVRHFLGHKDSVTDTAGQIVKCDVGGTQTNRDDAFSIQASCGEELFQKLTSEFDTVKRAATVRVAWTSGGQGYSETRLDAPFEYNGAQYVIDSPSTL